MTTHARAVIIPARLGSTRLPAKVLASDTGKPLLAHVIDSARSIPNIDLLAVATDSHEVARAAQDAGATAVMTSSAHPNGTSRIAQACDILELPDDAIVINVQADEPELGPEIPVTAIDAMVRTGAPMGTAAAAIVRAEDMDNANIVKVVCAQNGTALYFSRSPIPHRRDAQSSRAGAPLAHRHIGVYVYRRSFLRTYVSLVPAPLELTESLEQLRVLERGYAIAVGITQCDAPPGIDTPEQYQAFVRRVMSR